MATGKTFSIKGMLACIALCGLALLTVFPAMADGAGEGNGDHPPARVVSMNLCTDQLAMLVSAPGQLHSVSDWATRPRASNMADEARHLTLNSGSAEEIYLMQPDLVLAGSFTNRVSVDMLRRLGVRVAVFEPVASLADIPKRLQRMGRLLGREDAAARLVDDFEAALARAEAKAAELPRREAAYHYPNNYTSGAGTLAGDVMDRANLDNVAARLGFRGAARIPLERLVMTRPFLIRTRHISEGQAGRSYETARHPALKALAAEGGATVDERWQVCGTPFAILAIEALVAARFEEQGSSGRASEDPAGRPSPPRPGEGGPSADR